MVTQGVISEPNSHTPALSLRETLEDVWPTCMRVRMRVCVCVCVCEREMSYCVSCEQTCVHTISSAHGLVLPVSVWGGGKGRDRLDQGYQTGLTIPMPSPPGPALLRPRAEGNESQMTQVLEAAATRGT